MKKTHLLALVGMAFCASQAWAQKDGRGVLLGLRDGQGTNSPIIAGTRDPGDHDLVINIAGTASWDSLNDPDNIRILQPLGNGAIMTGIGWDVTVTTAGASWQSEARMYFDGMDLDGSGLFLAPGIGVNTSGTGTFSSGGVIDLSDNAIPDIPILSDGLLHIQFYESFDDANNVIDANWVSGTLTIRYTPAIDVPTLGEWGLLAFLVLLTATALFFMRRQRLARG